MTNDHRIPPTPVTGVYGALVKLLSRKMLGRVPDSVGVLWHQPAVMKDSMSVGGKIERWHALAPDLASYAAMASAAAIGCSWCLDFNYFMAHGSGRARRADGHGSDLGLAIVESIVCAHHATLDVVGLRQGGLHLRVALPG